jgi:trk system potassium uptake protein TrkH
MAIEAVTLPLMLLGNRSFVSAWFLRHGKLRIVARNGEVKVLTALIPLAAAGVFIFTSKTLYLHLGESVRVAVFETVSAITTTGFSTVSYENWNSL